MMQNGQSTLKLTMFTGKNQENGLTRNQVPVTNELHAGVNRERAV